MRAFAYTDRIELGALQEVRRPDPQPGPHDVLIGMRAVSLNYRDLAIARGHYHVGVKPPLVPTSDGAGEVLAVGAKVTRCAVGDLVCPVYLPDWIDGPVSPRVARRRLGGPSDGLLADLVCLNEEEVVKAPAHLSPEEAATLPVAGVTAWQALFHNGVVRPGETVVVHGSGGVANIAVQLARLAGARVIAVARSERHAPLLRRLGADDVLSSETAGEWPSQVSRLTDGRGADVVFDVVGGAALADSVRALRVGGLLHLVGYASGASAGLDIFDAIRHAAQILTATAGSRTSFEELGRALVADEVRPHIAARFSVDQIGEAFAQLEKGGQGGKIVISL